MKFDVLEAISLVKSLFGTSGEISISSLADTTAITLSTVHKGRFFRRRFELSPNDHQQSLDIRFNHAIRELQLAIAQIDTNPEENHNAI